MREHCDGSSCMMEAGHIFKFLAKILPNKDRDSQREKREQSKEAEKMGDIEDMEEQRVRRV